MNAGQNLLLHQPHRCSRVVLLRSMSKPIYLVGNSDSTATGQMAVHGDSKSSTNYKSLAVMTKWSKQPPLCEDLQRAFHAPWPPVPNKRAASPPGSQFSCLADCFAERRRAVWREGTSLSSLSPGGAGWHWWTAQDKVGPRVHFLSLQDTWDNDAVNFAA